MQFADAAPDLGDDLGTRFRIPNHHLYKLQRLWILSGRHESDWRQVIAQARVFGVLRNADHFVDGFRIIRFRYRADEGPDRIRIRYKEPDERLIDDRHLARIRGVKLVEVSALEDRRFHRSEIVRADIHEARILNFLALRIHHVNDETPHRADQWNVRRKRGGFYLWKRPDFIQQTRLECGPLAWRNSKNGLAGGCKQNST